MSKRTCVTGSSGFIARHLIPKLISDGYQVTGIDTRACDAEFGDNYRHVQGDIRDPAAVEEALTGAESILHLAAEHKDFGVSENEYFDVNVGGTKTLIENARRNEILEFVFISSVAVYGDTLESTTEDSLENPASPYGRSKLEAEKLIGNWVSECSERTAVILRPTVVYGEHNVANMYKLIDTICRGRYFQVGRGENRKSAVYVENLVDGLHYVMSGSNLGLTVANIADEPAMTSREIVETIANELGVKLREQSLPMWFALLCVAPVDWFGRITGIDVPITGTRVKKLATDTVYRSKYLSESGFRPRVSQDAGLRKTVRWYQDTISPTHKNTE